MAEQPPGDPKTQATPMPRPASSPAAVAGLISCLTGIILFVGVLGLALYVTLIDDTLLPLDMVWNPWRILIVVVLLLVIPIVVFRAVTLWIMGEGPKFADIEFAWKAGIDALAAQGLTVRSLPLFLVVGGGSQTLRRNLMTAAGGGYRIAGIPNSDAPFYWYVTDSAIYLYLNDVSWSNLAARQYRIATRGAGGLGSGPGPLAPSGPRPAPSMGATLIPTGETERPATPAAAETNDFLSGIGEQSPSAPSPPGMRGDAPRPQQKRAAYIGTISPDAAVSIPDPARQAPAPQRRTRRVGSEESSLMLRRLEAVCLKLRRFRQPFCSLNGILVLLPFDLLQASRQDIEELERAVAADLMTIRRETELRCPVTALVVAMEQERGFCELIRRIGREHAAKQRFGRSFDIRCVPVASELKKFTLHVSGVFEDWVYSLFKDESVLKHAGNPMLYSLLCKVRRSFNARLSDVLSHGFGFDPEVDHEPLYFSGCYFAATGPQADRQAFVSGVLAKLREQQGDLEWTDEALRADRRRGQVALVGWIVTGLLATALAAVWITRLMA